MIQNLPLDHKLCSIPSCYSARLHSTKVQVYIIRLWCLSPLLSGVALTRRSVHHQWHLLSIWITSVTLDIVFLPLTNVLKWTPPTGNPCQTTEWHGNNNCHPSSKWGNLRLKQPPKTSTGEGKSSRHQTAKTKTANASHSHTRRCLSVD